MSTSMLPTNIVRLALVGGEKAVLVFGMLAKTDPV